MSEPVVPRPVPGPPRPSQSPLVDSRDGGEARAGAVAPVDSRWAALAERPVAEHVAVYEAEHERLQRELSTIDQL